MIRRPPRSTRTDTLFPYTTLFRSLRMRVSISPRGSVIAILSVPYQLDFTTPGIRPLLARRSEEHTSELQSLMRISYAVFCLKKKKNNKNQNYQTLPKNNQLHIHYT